MGVIAFRNVANTVRRFIDRRLISDVILALALTALLSLTTSSNDLWGLQDGLLFPTSDRALTAWTWIYALPLAFRRKAPHASAVLFVTLCIIQLVFGPALVVTDCFALMQLYAVIAYGRRETARPFIIIAVGMAFLTTGVNTEVIAFGPLTMTGTERYQTAPYECLTPAGTMDLGSCDPALRTNAAIMLGMILIPVIAVIIMAYWQRARLATARWMQERNAALEARREEESHIAALAERARIARDMHDVVAHTLSIIIVQADGGRFAGANDRELAKSTMTTIRDESAKALADMQRLLGIFGGHHDDGTDAMKESPTHHDESEDDDHPSYANIDGLVAQARNADSDLRLERKVLGNPLPDKLGAPAQIVVYRIMQESLTNIRKYAGSDVHADIEEQWDEDGLRLRILDDGRGAASMADGHTQGYGLIGMRERLTSLGGSGTAGPRIGGGFEVTAFIPYASSPDMRDPVDSTAGGCGESPLTASVANGERSGTAGRISTRVASGFKQAVIDHIHTMVNTIRNDREDRHAGKAPETDDFNIIEKVSEWTERHYLLMDLLVAVALFMMYYVSAANGMTSGYAAVRNLSNMLTLLPLVWRRRFPQASAAVFAAVTILELLALPWNTLAPLVSVYSVYSVTLYGPRTAKRWVIPTIALGSLTFAVNFTAQNYLGMSMTTLIGSIPAIMGDTGTTKSIGALPVLLTCTFAACITLFGVMAAGMWSRARGANMLVLQAREEALRDEEAKQRILAANMERDRIGANIRADVSDTLLGVMGKADAGLRLLDSNDTDTQMISDAFAGIAKEGRAALKRMRQLLGVLRETGFSDDAQREGMRLAPASPLDEQLQWKAGGPTGGAVSDDTGRSQ
ncbi:sensor histidine kinase [Bifidobacterium primatium]|uniref:histidine kinase n=1 Tax=Bifidobacterium primatium TaxID=2045438 RepID=A0A2M9H8I2_9BIFI|nr:histidine kinase [Bifidobacterium primatium]PJM73120.1 sensor histidine kinase [Bifidobacterium primatium]